MINDEIPKRIWKEVTLEGERYRIDTVWGHLKDDSQIIVTQLMKGFSSW